MAVGDIEKSYDDLERLQLSRRHQLNALLGLAPDAPLPLAGASEIPHIDAQRVRRDLADLANRRPDLIALQYGYRSEDAKLRQAILSQFPNLTIGLAGGRDSSSIYSFGPQASFELPVFNRNEGAIALEQATREALNREFNARLTAAAGEIGAFRQNRRCSPASSPVSSRASRRPADRRQGRGRVQAGPVRRTRLCRHAGRAADA